MANRPDSEDALERTSRSAPGGAATFRGVIETLLPEAATVVEAFDDPPGVALFPQEQERMRQAVDKRVREFTTVRHCARTALDRLGIPPVPILPDKHGAPQWPAGIVGSMTHCDGYRAAVLARATDLATVGVDAEPHEPLPDDVLGTVSLPEERKRLGVLAAQQPEVCWDRLLFSAKESVYKAWYPLTGAWLDFEEASITFSPGANTGPSPNPSPNTIATPGPRHGLGPAPRLSPGSSPTHDPRSDTGTSATAVVSATAAVSSSSSSAGTADPLNTFYARLLVPGPIVGGMRLAGFSGRWMVRDGLLFTAIAIAAPPTGP
jgi:4'-phosphopantetheinyl transferase EntD